MNRIMKLLAAQWPDDYFGQYSPLNDLSTGLEQIIAGIRKYKIAGNGFALFVGFILRYLYGIVKNSILIKKLISLLPPLIDQYSVVQMQILTVVVNAIADSISSLISALICGSILVYLFRHKAIDLGIWSVCMFLALGPRFLFFWQAPEIGAKISILIAPIIATVVFASTITVITKRTNRITPGSTATGNSL